MYLIFGIFVVVYLKITNEIIGEADFWKDELENVIRDWKDFSSRSSSPVFGRLSPSLLADFETKKREAIEQIQGIISPNGYHLQTTIDGSLDGFFIDTLPIDY